MRDRSEECANRGAFQHPSHRARTKFMSTMFWDTAKDVHGAFHAWHVEALENYMWLGTVLLVMSNYHT